MIVKIDLEVLKKEDLTPENIFKKLLIALTSAFNSIRALTRVWLSSLFW